MTRADHLGNKEQERKLDYSPRGSQKTRTYSRVDQVIANAVSRARSDAKHMNAIADCQGSYHSEHFAGLTSGMQVVWPPLGHKRQRKPRKGNILGNLIYRSLNTPRSKGKRNALIDHPYATKKRRFPISLI